MPRTVAFANYVYYYFESTGRADYEEVQKEEKTPTT